MSSFIDLISPFLKSTYCTRTGKWIALRPLSKGIELIQQAGPAFDVVVDNNFLPHSPFIDQREHRVKDIRSTLGGRGCEIEFEYEGIRLTQIVELDANDPLLRQKIRVDCLDGYAPRKLTAIHHYIPNFCVGNPSECFLHAPGQHIPIDTPYAERALLPLDRRYREPLPGFPTGWLQSAPDETSGVVAIENRTSKLIASSWLYSEIATSFPTLDGGGTYLSTEYRHQISLWLTPGASVTSEEFCILATESSLEDHLKEFRKITYKNLSSAADSPKWLGNARLLQIPPYPVKLITENLRKFRDIGFNLIYLNPVQAGNWYVIEDHYKINPKVGTVDELKEFVRAAHAEGFKVLFDFIPQGIGASSPFIGQHPEWLVRDEMERPFGSHGWGSRAGAPLADTLSLDWGNPDYRKFVIDWAVWYIETFDIDGFRTDALHWKEANFSLNNPRPAWATTFGGVRLGEELRNALRSVKSDILLLSEVWGPIFQRSHDATYENGWLLKSLNEGWFTNRPIFTAKQYSRYLAMAKLARPPNTCRANFTANHDMSYIVSLGNNSPLGNTVTFLHVMNEGLPFIWHEEIRNREAFYTELFKARDLLTGYSINYLETDSEFESIFIASWMKAGSSPFVTICNLSLERVPFRYKHPFADCELERFFSSDSIKITSDKGEWVGDLPGGCYALFRIKLLPSEIH